MTATYTLERTQYVPRPVDEVFAFFSDAYNLERITPGFLGFKILTPAPIAMRAGTLIDYRLRLFGVPFGWTTKIESFEPSKNFVDTQLTGPYRLWHHTHTFSPVAGGTLMTDRVRYELPLGPLGTIAHVLFVERTLNAIFDYRKTKIAELFGVPELESVPA